MTAESRRSRKEEPVRTGDGGWSIMRILPYRSINDVIDGVVITFTDVTRLKRAENDVRALSDALQKRLLELRVLLEVLPIGIAFTDRDRGEVRVNRAAAELLGGELGADSAEPLPYLLPAEEVTKLPELARLVNTDRPIRDLEVALPQTTGTAWLVVNSAPLRDALNRVYGSVCSLANVSERRLAMEQVLVRAQQQEAVARLGLHALAAIDPVDTLTEGLSLIVSLFGADACTITQLGSNGAGLNVVAQTGLPLASPEPRPLEARSLEAHLLDARQPVVFEDLRREHRFDPDPRLSSEGIASGAAVLIQGAVSEPWGVLAAYFRAPRQLRQDDCNFLQSVSHIFTLALQRTEAERSPLTGKRALRLARVFRPEVLIVDFCLLEEQDGGHLARALREQNPTLHVILITGMLIDEVREAVADIHALRLLAKPLELDDVERHVRELVPGSPRAASRRSTRGLTPRAQ